MNDIRKVTACFKVILYYIFFPELVCNIYEKFAHAGEAVFSFECHVNKTNKIALG